MSHLHYSQWKTVPEKALTISGADRSTRRGGACQLHAVFMNQLCINWGYQEEFSSTARPIAIDNQQVSARLVGCPARHKPPFFSQAPTLEH
jgi:hypothetical protein